METRVTTRRRETSTHGGADGAHDLLRNLVDPTIDLRSFAASDAAAGNPTRDAGIEATMSTTIEATMTCRELVDFLGEYVAGTLDASARTKLDAHLADCRACADYVRGYRDTIRLAKDAAARDDDAAVAAMPDELVDAILDAATSRRRR
jgi:hypothetical protein